MPLRLNVGVTKKLGLPAYSSIGASCNLELELENGLLRDPAGFRDQVEGAFLAARQAVDDELARLQARAGASEVREAGDGHGHRDDGHTGNGSHDGNGARAGNGSPAPRPVAHHGRAGKPATPSQVRAIVSIARRQRADLDGLLCDHGVTRPEALLLADASRLIDQLKAAAEA
jgi:hypothetical protein